MYILRTLVGLVPVYEISGERKNYDLMEPAKSFDRENTSY